MIDTDILIVGAGPVGLIAALDLVRRGIRVCVLELRPAGDPPSVKCNHVSSRTMEILRTLGLSRAIRAVGLPDDFPNDVVFRTRFSGREFARIPIPCRRNRYAGGAGPDTGWPTAEPPHRCNQRYFEPILFGAAKQSPRIRVINRADFTTARQDDQGVTATYRDLETQEIHTVHARYLIGCDGGRSTVRRLIGSTLQGDAVVQRVQSTLIDAPDLLATLQGSPAWMNYNYNPERAGTVIAIDGRRHWLVHNYLLPDEVDFGSVDRDASLRAILGVDDQFKIEILSEEDWIGRRLVADKFREERIFIAGDAAHLWVPYAGYGMNAGIADATNLTWLLGAVLNGWAPSGILEAYVAERKPITEQVSKLAMGYAAGAIRERNTVPAAIEDATPEGERARRDLGEKAYRANVQQYACAGLNYGYYYDDSPIIVKDSEPPPAYSMHDYTPSTVPGCRCPHFFVADGRSLYDLWTDGFALLQLDRTIDLCPLRDAAAKRRIPLVILPLDRALDHVPPAYQHSLVLARPDRHVAWRGKHLIDPEALLDQITGAGTDRRH